MVCRTIPRYWNNFKFINVPYFLKKILKQTIKNVYLYLQNPDIVLVHYLNVPYPDDSKIMVTNSVTLWGEKKEWSKEELSSQLKPMCKFSGFSFSVLVSSCFCCRSKSIYIVSLMWPLKFLSVWTSFQHYCWVLCLHILFRTLLTQPSSYTFTFVELNNLKGVS
jgi:hypothetical protein